MKLSLKLYCVFGFLFLAIFSGNAQGVTHYVDPNCANPVSPYTDWSSAATNIQEAVDSANPGDLVLVTNGVYSTGGRVASGPITNCVVVTNAITVESVNGASATVIEAYPTPGTNGSQRCVYLGTGSVLSGFALMNGSVANDSGGGVDCASGNCIVSNCVIVGNWAQDDGGGGYWGMYSDCTVSNNGADAGGGIYLSDASSAADCTINSNNANYYGGGVYCISANIEVTNSVIAANYAQLFGGGGYSGSYYNCVINGNSCDFGGGGLYVFGGSSSSPAAINNCLIVHNSAQEGGAVYSETVSYGVTMNNCTVAENSAITWPGIYSISTGTFITNCILYYDSVPQPNSDGGEVSGTTNLCNCCTTAAGGVNGVGAAPGFVNMDGGNFQLAAWSPCIDAGTNAAVPGSVDLAGNPRVVNGTVDIGAYEYQYQFTNLIRYVSLKSANAIPPFTNWLTAASNIQAAIDISSPSDFIIVSNGVYNTGGRLADDATTNRIVLEVPVTVQALSGTALTLIEGNYPNYPGTRCAYVTNGATLIGFTLTNGYADDGTLTNENGAGVWCESLAATINGCVCANDYALNSGGGAYSGTLISCQFNGNTARSGGGGAYSASLIGCLLTNNIADYGGGACFGVISNCWLTGNHTWGGLNSGGGACSNILYDSMLVSNFSVYYGGGGSSCVLSNSTLIGNTAWVSGGGAYSSTLGNCTLIGNIATNTGGGAYSSALGDCTLIGNTALVSGGGAYSSTLSACTLTENRATNGGGAAYGVLLCCVLTNNTAVNGGGIFDSSLTNCTLIANVAASGGGAFGATLNDCLISSNSAFASGGGACLGTLSNCVISNNAALNGGGVASNTLYNCTVAWNTATNGGGGSYGGTLNNCLIFTNAALSTGGGSYSSVLNLCDLFNNAASGNGGGAHSGMLIDCILSNNVVYGPTFAYSAYGAGAADAILTNCLIIKNRIVGAFGTGGGGYDCYLDNCTIAFNTGPNIAGIYGGGATNCIIYYNVGYYYVGANSNWDNGKFTCCCTVPLPTGLDSGIGNFTNAPLFVSTNDFHLQSTSPCINSGNNSFVSSTTELDGNPRIVGGTVDMGAYEFQTPASVISYEYLQQYGLPTDGSVDYADLDGTGFDIYQDWIAGLNPTNPASILAMLSPTATNNASGVTVTWQSVSGILYNLQRSTNLSAEPAFSTIRTNISGQTNTTSYTDTSATNIVPYFYRVGVSAE